MENETHGQKEKASGSQWLRLAVLLVIVACALIARMSLKNPYALRYRHHLAYPAAQSRELLQVGSLDRG